jgi:N-acetylglucosaminyl-diphospho-decaprenol L-rhamnosyltransferase
MSNEKKTLPTLTIVIVNWNTGDQLRECIASIALASRRTYCLSEVVVVDNASQDDSLQGIDTLDLVVRVINNNANLGFAAACNQGAAGCLSDYLLFLNPDTRLFENSLVEPINFMEQQSQVQVGICGIRLLDESGATSNSAGRFPIPRIIFGSVFRLDRIWPTIFPSHFLRPEEVEAGGVVDQVIGAFFLIRKSVFQLCNGFDERFFMYYEEVDLSLSVRQAGYYSHLLPTVTAFHKGGGASERVKAARLFYSLRSRLLYGNKHYSALERLALYFLTVIELPLRLVNAIARASWSDCVNTAIAYWRLLTHFLRAHDG